MTAVVTSAKKYEKHKLSEAMKAVAEEANEALRKGYSIVGFQVVESELLIVSLYRRVPAELVSAALTGE